MRRRRAILYDDDPAILNGLTQFFKELDYEVIAYREPVECAVYNESDSCEKQRPCADLMITDLEMPRMSGLEMLERQSRRGCRLNVRNKAVLSGSLDSATKAAVRNLGCAAFQKPCRLSTLAAWALECEQRMDLTQPLGVARREHREVCRCSAIFNVEGQDDWCVAEVINRSGSGLCLLAERPLAVAQILNVQTRMPLLSAHFEVRWTRPDVGGGSRAGVMCC